MSVTSHDPTRGGWENHTGSKGGAGSRPLLRRGSLHNGFPFSLRNALGIHDSDFLSRPTTSSDDFDA
jgi:hypothetical protein